MTFAVVDSLLTVGPSLMGPSLTVTGALAGMDQVGVDQAIVVPARPPSYHLAEANDTIVRAVMEQADRLVGLARVDPHRADAADELVRTMDAGLAGLFLHPQQEVFAINDPMVDRLVAICGERSLPVVIATGYPWLSEPLQVAELARRNPGTTIIMTNGGQYNISGLGQYDAQLTLESCPNVLIQTAGVYRQDFIEGTVERFGAGRVLFASNAPQFDCRYEILRLRLSRLPDPDKEAVLGGTAREVFRIS